MSVDEKRLELVAAGLMTIDQVEEFLGLSRSKIYSLCGNGLPFVKIGRSRRIPRQAVLEFAAAHLRGALGEVTRDNR